ncbi:hypothetical protein D9615_005212 [Tricholomella constricta]|uniref:AP complex subunit sigma n=1 Tax=Tricholomella constricta TaxID=117010 RepID=A0A8H5H737_9AGAR|nr:hypothetical protein D9615_005212 [Tricholomella constricta]
MPSKAKSKIIQDACLLRLFSFTVQRANDTIGVPGSKVVYRQYASLFFVCEVGEEENELMTLEVIHRYVEVLDKFFGNVCELDLIFDFQKAYTILDELIVAGELAESNRRTVLTSAEATDIWERDEILRDALQDSFIS